MQQSWDPQGEAASALTRAVEGFGPQVLGSADMLSGLLEDDVPHLPREVALLTAAARSGTWERLTERMRQGLAPDHAVSMAATEMASRTAMDASGAQWAVGEFARVLGHPTQPATLRAPAPPPAVDVSTKLPPPPRPMPAPDAPTALAQPSPTTVADGAVSPSRGLAGTAAAVSGLVGVLTLAWLLPDFSGGFKVVIILQNLVLLAASAAAAIWVGRKTARGGGFAVVFGLMAAGVSGSIYYLAFAAEIGFLSSARHRTLEVAMGLLLVASAIAASLAFAGLVRGRYLARHKAGPAGTVTALAGFGFVLATILPEQSYNGSSYSIFISNHGWWIVWAVLFLVFVGLTPVLSFFIPRRDVLRAMWVGWLAFGLSWQISWSPVNNEKAAPGLYVTWLLWLVVLAGTIAIGARRPAAQPAVTAPH